ncbi:hypothetical protein OsI_04137 [Oryza sativa Indica Group]|uniref:Uncharacterized protein n=1 Tax=Oryza sativa subsp. indica TaxID=39946 RepID=B8AAY4_ORYSI|nr:hypothetical protein OsI_04137 [Oryza sativa Indica Group]
MATGRATAAAGGGEGGSNSGGEGDGEGRRVRRRPMVHAGGGDGDGGGDGVGRGHKGGCGGPYAAMARCSAATAAVSLRSTPLGRIWRVAGGGAVVTVEALAMTADVGRWWQQVEVRGEDDDGEVARRSTVAAVVVVAVIAVTGSMAASDG